ncbi:MAG TPA: transcriptional repressor [Thermoanaerobaculia bacterium]|nr:transcriptional repressor [Thermoanaerobaculia bacterium]
MQDEVVEVLTRHGIQPSAHRVAVAQYVLHTDEHPSAERVWARVKSRFPMISRATVYNTLNLFVEKELLRELHLSPESVVFDPNMDRHHHLIDEDTGRIHDVPWGEVEVCNIAKIGGYEIRDYQVVMRGRKRRAK